MNTTALITGAVSGAAAVVGGVMTNLGFTSGGIAASSFAAGAQAGLGKVVASSAFATAQSLGAAGVFATVGVLGGVGLVAAGAVYLITELI